MVGSRQQFARDPFFPCERKPGRTKNAYERIMHKKQIIKLAKQIYFQAFNYK